MKRVIYKTYGSDVSRHLARPTPAAALEKDMDHFGIGAQEQISNKDARNSLDWLFLSRAQRTKEPLLFNAYILSTSAPYAFVCYSSVNLTGMEVRGAALLTLKSSSVSGRLDTHLGYKSRSIASCIYSCATINSSCPGEDLTL